ncbi:hypothetical protein CKO51_25805 [Rhodopirellula sp. SM50]|nr:O-antigen ligase family protein [Rhodopirellula sp. SM50]PAY16594.1 hypothetical protein CKO51_25805 [Rhodopirellula sp. SM50]
MLGYIFVTAIFAASVIAGLLRPYWGLLGFYAFVFLQPEWTWRWSIPPGLGYQKYIGLSVLIGVLLTGLSGNRFRGWLALSVGGLVAFLAIAYVSAQQTVAPGPTATFMDTVTKMIVMTLVTIRVVDSPQKAIGLLWVIVISNGYNAYQINEDYFATGVCRFVERAWGLKGDSNVYSVFTVPAIAGSIALCVFSKQWRARVPAAVILVLQVHQMMLMESRGTMLGTILILATAIWLMPKNRYTVLGTTAAVLIGAALAGPSVVREFMSTFESSENRDSSAESRITLWKAGYEITRDYPMLGVGPYAVQAVIPKYAYEFSHVRYKAPHNLFLEVSAGCGIPALFCYLTYYVVPWWICFRAYRRHRNKASDEELLPLFALAICLPGYFLASLFASGAMVESMYVLIALSAGSAAACGTGFPIVSRGS